MSSSALPTALYGTRQVGGGGGSLERTRLCTETDQLHPVMSDIGPPLEGIVRLNQLELGRGIP